VRNITIARLQESYQVAHVYMEALLVVHNVAAVHHVKLLILAGDMMIYVRIWN